VWSNAHIRSGAVIGDDCIIGEKTYIASDVVVGNRVKINAMVYLCAGVTLEQGVMVSAGVVFTNDRYPRATTPDLTELRTSDADEHTQPTLVREGATIGAGATVGSGLEVGRFALVGMGAVVTRSVPDFHLVVGNPARSVSAVCRCGQPVLRVLAELGLEDDMQWVETKTGYYGGDALYSVSTTLEFLRLPALRILDKLRLGGTIFYGSKIRNGRRLERIKVEDWLRRWSGRRTFDTFWLPLLRAKLGDNYRHASASFIWATIQRLYRARRSGLKKELFGYVPGGYARITERFGEVLRELGVDIVLGVKVVDVTADDGGTQIRLDDGRAIRCDRAVVTAAAPIAARLCPQLDASERSALEDVRYQGIVCVSLVLRRPLGPYYLTYITDPACPFTAVVEMSTLVDRERFLGGFSLVYLPKYVTPDDPLFDVPDDEIVASFLPYLQRMYPEVADEDLACAKVSRVRNVLAVTTLEYSAHEPPMRTSVPGLALVSSANIVNGTLNVDETMQLAERAVAELSGR
jgi:protoporphyrinogen oxidase